ncbi:MAG: hypothetical protein WC406_02730 [Methanoregula sp.]|jgi:hypothetical protein|nr:hypothetical protein [Methanoregula sp.]
MMQKAGYIQRTGCSALDCDGRMHEVIEMYILGIRYAIRLADLVRGLSGHGAIQVEAINREWNNYLGTTCGLAKVSASGKALNIGLFGAGDFTVSLATLRAVIYKKQRLAVIVMIPGQPVPQPAWRAPRTDEDQQLVSAAV